MLTFLLLENRGFGVLFREARFFEKGEKVMYPYLWPEEREMSFDDGDFYLDPYIKCLSCRYWT